MTQSEVTFSWNCHVLVFYLPKLCYVSEGKQARKRTSFVELKDLISGEVVFQFFSNFLSLPTARLGINEE